jgi:hypothetical protein
VKGLREIDCDKDGKEMDLDQIDRGPSQIQRQFSVLLLLLSFDCSLGDLCVLLSAMLELGTILRAQI